MEPKDYWDIEPTKQDKEPLSDEEISILIKKAYETFMLNLELVSTMVKAFPAEMQLDMLIKMMKDI